MKILVLILTVFLNCQSKKQKQFYSLLLDKNSTPNAYFSYPGRFTEFSKKLIVKKRILEIIHSTSRKLHLYVYSLNDPDIIKALIQARDRGVDVSVRGDIDSDYSQLVKEGIKVFIWQKSGIHHVKVIIADDLVFTGTGNFTEYGLTNDYNGYIEFNLQDRKDDFISFMNETYAKPVFIMNGINIISSPGDGMHIQSLLIREIESAKSSIDYLIFNHYDQLITHALRKASLRGVRVRGVYNQPMNPEGEYLQENFYGIESFVFKEENEDTVSKNNSLNGGLLHHKTMIIDGNRVLTGSYNYSTSARDDNRELIMLITISSIVQEYEKEFDRILQNSQQVFPETFKFSETTISAYLTSITAVCLSEAINQPIVEIGQGVFKTYLYYNNWQMNQCGDIFAPTIATLFGINKSGSIIAEAILHGATFYERNSSKKYVLPVSTGLIGSDKNIAFVKADYISRLYPGKLEFRLNDNTLTGNKMYLWTPGKLVQESRLAAPDAADDTLYQANMTLESAQLNKGIVFIEKMNEMIYFCYDSGVSDAAIQNFLKEGTVLKSLLLRKEMEIPQCSY